MKNEHKEIIRRIADIARQYGCKKICDYGCGNGRLIEALKAAGIRAEYTGIDFIADYPELKDGQGPDTRYIDRAGAAYEELLRSGETFDLIFICNSIPHFKQPCREFSNITSLMGKDSLLHISDINFINETEADIARNIDCYIEELALNFRKDFCRHFYAVDEVLDLLEPFGLETVAREEYRVPPTPEERVSDTARLLEHYDRRLAGLKRVERTTLNLFMAELLSAGRKAVEKNGADYSARYGLLFRTATKKARSFPPPKKSDKTDFLGP